MPVCELYECFSEILGFSLQTLFGAASFTLLLSAVVLTAIARNWD